MVTVNNPQVFEVAVFETASLKVAGVAERRRDGM